MPAFGSLAHDAYSSRTLRLTAAGSPAANLAASATALPQSAASSALPLTNPSAILAHTSNTQKGYACFMTARKDRVLTSLLWGAVAAVGQYTMLFLIIIRRIHVRFENEAPIFYVDPRGPITLTKDSALASVWVMTVIYGLLVALLVYARPRPSRGTSLGLGALALTLSAITALAEPLWGLIVLADFGVLCPLLLRRTAEVG